jgi:hypothetical protein
VQRRLIVMRVGVVEEGRASDDENLYAWRDRVSAVCEATTALLAHDCQGNGPAARLGDPPHSRVAVLGLSKAPRRLV